jgi:serine protease Do
VLISAVAPDSFAATRGLVAGDVVLAVQQAPVSTPAEVEAGMEAVLREGRVWVLLLVRSRAGLRWVDVPLVRPADGRG